MAQGKSPRKVGIFGAGLMGKFHAESAASYGARIVSVYDPRIEAARAVAAKHGAYAAEDPTDFFDRQLDLVIIATPPAVRVEPVRMACERGIHLLIEKPPALRLHDARTCLGLIEKAGVMAGCGFQLRYGSAFEKLRDMLADQTVHLVRTLLTTGSYLNAPANSWYLQKRHSGGSISSDAIHPLDAVRYMLNNARCVKAHALAVKNMAQDWPDTDCENSVQVTYELDNGVFGTHMNHSGCEAGDINFEFIGPHLRLYTIGWGNSSIKGRYKGKDVKEPVTEQSRLGLDKTGAMLRAIETGDTSLIRSPFSDAIHTMELVEAANRSILTGQFVRTEGLGRELPVPS